MAHSNNVEGSCALLKRRYLGLCFSEKHLYSWGFRGLHHGPLGFGSGISSRSATKARGWASPVMSPNPLPRCPERGTAS